MEAGREVVQGHSKLHGELMTKLYVTPSQKHGKKYNCATSSSNTKGMRGYILPQVCDFSTEYFSLYERISLDITEKQ